MKTAPYISVVITGRNDDYGADFPLRLNTFIRSLDYQVAKWPGVFELIVVEWNPLKDHEGIDAIIEPTKNLAVRVITAPAKLHDTFESSQSFLEFHGKNVGVRRARGEFVLVTNPDILFTQSLIDNIASRRLRNDTFYRTDRFDFRGEGIEDIATEDLVDFALSRTFVMHGVVDNQSISCEIANAPVDPAKLPKSRVDGTFPHTNACGDFLLASRENFYTVRGFYETVEHKWHVDSISLMRFWYAKIKQQVFVAPDCVFHFDHRRKDPDMSFQAIDWERIKTMKPSTSWGLHGHTLEEKRIEPR